MADSLINTSNALNAAVDTGQQNRIRRLADNLDKPQEDRAGLEKAAKEFEGVFMNTLMKAMRKTVPDNKMFNSTGPTKFYQQMHDAEMAKALATGHSSMGIADLIVRQFEANISAQDDGQDNEPILQPRHPQVGPPQASVLARYQTMQPVGDEAVKMARLGQLAANLGQAYADTLKNYKNEIAQASAATGVEPALILAVVVQESGGRSDAVSPKGAQGLMQLMPGTADYLGVDEPFDPAENIMGGARYLSRMCKRYDGRLDLGLAAYNAGPGNVDKAGRQIPNFRETKNYVRNILEKFNDLGGGMNLANSGLNVAPDQPLKGN